MVEAGERVIKYGGKIKRSENVILRQCRRETLRKKCYRIYFQEKKRERN